MPRTKQSSIIELRKFIRGLIREQLENADIKAAFGLEVDSTITRRGWDGWDSHSGPENDNKQLQTGYEMAYTQSHDELQGLVKVPGLFNIDDEIAD
jgi:hypothetical protein